MSDFSCCSFDAIGRRASSAWGCRVARFLVFRFDSDTGRLWSLSHVGAQAHARRIQNARVHKQSVYVPVTMWVNRTDEADTTAQGVSMSNGLKTAGSGRRGKRVAKAVIRSKNATGTSERIRKERGKVVVSRVSKERACPTRDVKPLSCSCKTNRATGLAPTDWE